MGSRPGPGGRGQDGWRSPRRFPGPLSASPSAHLPLPQTGNSVGPSPAPTPPPSVVPRRPQGTSHLLSPRGPAPAPPSLTLCEPQAVPRLFHIHTSAQVLPSFLEHPPPSPHPSQPQTDLMTSGKHFFPKPVLPLPSPPPPLPRASSFSSAKWTRTVRPPCPQGTQGPLDRCPRLPSPPSCPPPPDPPECPLFWTVHFSFLS